MRPGSAATGAKFPNDPDYGTALYNSNMVLGLLAMRAGNRKAAVQSMLAASRAPATEELAYSASDFTLKLPELLFQAGEHDAVAEFLEGFAKFNVSRRATCRNRPRPSAAGRSPSGY
jgi:hypothetical protein